MPPIPELPAGGLYVLLIRLTAVTSLRIGALGFFDLSPGWYLYTGSARRNLPQRLARHFAPDKPPRWHIDTLTATPNAHTQGAIVHPGGGLSECELNRAVGKLAGERWPVPRFGAGDCRRCCPAHLAYSPRRITLHRLAELAPQSIVVEASGFACPAS